MIVLVRKVIKGVHTVMDEFKEQKKALAVESALKLDRASFPTHCVFTRESLAKSSDTVMVLCFYGELKNGRSPPSSDLEPVWLPVSREYAAAAVRSVDLNHPADPTQVSTDTDPSWNENRSFVLNRGSSTVYVHKVVMQRSGVYCCWVVLRWTVLGLWFILALPLRLIESLVIGVVAQFFTLQLKQDPYDFVSYFILGLLFSYGFFLPLSRVDGIEPGVLCSAYLATISWVAGQMIMAILIVHGVTHRLQLGHRCPTLTSGRCRLRVPADSGYLGLALGLSVAFPVASMEYGDAAWDAAGGDERPQLSSWCRLNDEWPSEIVYAPLFFISLLAANMDTNTRISIAGNVLRGGYDHSLVSGVEAPSAPQQDADLDLSDLLEQG